jgi:hypothetical protein
MPPHERRRAERLRASEEESLPASPDAESGGIGESPALDQRGKSGSGDADESPSIFIPKESLMGKSYEPGQTIQMLVKAVDPETGEVEVVCSPGSKTPSSSEEPPSIRMLDDMEDMDDEDMD